MRKFVQQEGDYYGDEGIEYVFSRCDGVGI